MHTQQIEQFDRDTGKHHSSQGLLRREFLIERTHLSARKPVHVSFGSVRYSTQSKVFGHCLNSRPHMAYNCEGRTRVPSAMFQRLVDKQEEPQQQQQENTTTSSLSSSSRFSSSSSAVSCQASFSLCAKVKSFGTFFSWYPL